MAAILDSENAKPLEELQPNRNVNYTPIANLKQIPGNDCSETRQRAQTEPLDYCKHDSMLSYAFLFPDEFGLDCCLYST